MSRRITIHKVDSTEKLAQPICGAFLTPLDREHFVSVHEENVNCSYCLRLLDELKHKKDGRLVF